MNSTDNKVTIILDYEQAEQLLTFLKAINAIQYGEWLEVRRSISKQLKGGD
jgi:hypothetical protein